MNVWMPDQMDTYLRERQELLRRSPIPGVHHPVIPRKPS